MTNVYDTLDIRAKITALDEYVNEICPYEDFEETEDIADLEYSVRIWMESGEWTLDQAGHWKEVER